MEQKSVLEMARGAIAERADYEMSRILENRLDPNTSAAKKRVLTLTVEILPDEERAWLEEAKDNRALLTFIKGMLDIYVKVYEDGVREHA